MWGEQKGLSFVTAVRGLKIGRLSLMF